ncbi:MAG TPA: hypothetical protein V6C81_14260 [Planktothrix sp.]|jgi:hypothetical protein
MITPAERLVKWHQEIEDILSLYGAKAVRIWGVPYTNSGVPDVDILRSRDEEKLAPIIVCYRKNFIASINLEENRWAKLDQDGFFLSEVLTLLLGFLVNICEERAVKKFRPVTYSKTVETHHWFDGE